MNPSAYIIETAILQVGEQQYFDHSSLSRIQVLRTLLNARMVALGQPMTGPRGAAHYSDPEIWYPTA